MHYTIENFISTNKETYGTLEIYFGNNAIRLDTWFYSVYLNNIENIKGFVTAINWVTMIKEHNNI